MRDRCGTRAVHLLRALSRAARFGASGAVEAPARESRGNLMTIRRRTAAIGAALALVVSTVAVAPATASSATYTGKTCSAKYIRTKELGKTERTKGNCKRITVALYLYLNGSPGIYVWGSEGSTTGRAVVRTRPAGHTISVTHHTILNGSKTMVLAV